MTAGRSWLWTILTWFDVLFWLALNPVLGRLSEAEAALTVSV